MFFLYRLQVLLRLAVGAIHRGRAGPAGVAGHDLSKYKLSTELILVLGYDQIMSELHPNQEKESGRETNLKDKSIRQPSDPKQLRVGCPAGVAGHDLFLLVVPSCPCIHMYICMCMYVYLHVCVYVCMYVCTYVRTYVRMYVCIYIYIYVYTCNYI